MSQPPYAANIPDGEQVASQMSQPSHFPTQQHGQATSQDPGIQRAWYGIGFGHAIGRFFRKYVMFNGRASRGEYWWWWLMNAIIMGIGSILLSTVGVDWKLAQAYPSGWFDNPPTNAFGAVLGSILGVYVLVSVIPSLALSVRRLHDSNHRGWWFLVALIPLIGWIWYIILMATPTYPGPTPWDGQRRA
ncbi:MAG: DUF805 domain-containing protein [Propionibacteriaceae bacterium]|jgi:uncharacterized membrane protein YhaH (DUF805 family)|nr:DUF805 domain-containing protein [Propionibacteriaceae bacterium]